jgi:hypothetical protein
MGDKEDLEIVKTTLQRLLNRDGFNEFELELINSSSARLLPIDHQELARMCAASEHRSILWRDILLYLIEYYARAFKGVSTGKIAASDVGAMLKEQAGIIEMLESKLAENARLKTDWGKLGADILHSRPHGSREKRGEVLEAWASGRYPNKDKCAEKEALRLKISFSTARKALRNAPQPKKKV